MRWLAEIVAQDTRYEYLNPIIATPNRLPGVATVQATVGQGHWLSVINVEMYAS